MPSKGEEMTESLESIPEALYYTRRAKDEIWDVIVADCPFCHHKHKHGGGIGELCDIKTAYRESHCMRGTYKLKEKE